MNGRRAKLPRSQERSTTACSNPSGWQPTAKGTCPCRSWWDVRRNRNMTCKTRVAGAPPPPGRRISDATRVIIVNRHQPSRRRRHGRRARINDVSSKPRVLGVLQSSPHWRRLGPISSISVVNRANLTSRRVGRVKFLTGYLGPRAIRVRSQSGPSGYDLRNSRIVTHASTP